MNCKCLPINHEIPNIAYPARVSKSAVYAILHTLKDSSVRDYQKLSYDCLLT